MPVVWSDRCRLHEPGGEIWVGIRTPGTETAELSVVPRRDPRLRRRPQILRGETPDAVRIPSGCRFHPRCPIAFERCPVEEPVLKPTSAGHRAACHLT